MFLRQDIRFVEKTALQEHLRLSAAVACTSRLVDRQLDLQTAEGGHLMTFNPQQRRHLYKPNGSNRPHGSPIAFVSDCCCSNLAGLVAREAFELGNDPRGGQWMLATDAAAGVQ